MRIHSISQKRDVFCIFLTKTSLFPFGFKNDFYVICAIASRLIENVMTNDCSFQSLDHSPEIKAAVCNVTVEHFLRRLHAGIVHTLL